MNFLIVNLLNEGGPTFMYPLLFMLIICVLLIIKAFVSNSKTEKTKKLVSHISLFALVWGFLGQMIGLIGAFDAIESLSNISPQLLAGGLKVALLSTSFGMVVFLVGRLGLIALNIAKK